MFQIVAHTASPAALAARFATFAEAANCATAYAKQRGECRVKLVGGGFLADFVPSYDRRQVSVFTTSKGEDYVLEWAR